MRLLYIVVTCNCVTSLTLFITQGIKYFLKFFKVRKRCQVYKAKKVLMFLLKISLPIE